MAAKPITKAAISAAGIDTAQFDAAVNSSSALFHVPAEWIKAVIGRESSFNPSPAVRPNDRSYGLMQLTPATAKGLGFAGRIPDDLLNPDTNIYFGTMLLGQLRARYGDDFKAVYSAYNSGSATKYLSSPAVAVDVAGAEAWLAYFSA